MASGTGRGQQGQRLLTDPPSTSVSLEPTDALASSSLTWIISINSLLLFWPPAWLTPQHPQGSTGHLSTKQV